MLADLQALLLRALRDPDPAAFLAAALARADCPLSDDERRWLGAASADGLRLSRMLVRKLRLQRLLRGDPAFAALVAGDPAALARRFAAYDAAVAPQAVFPRDEAAAFAAFEAGRARQ